MRMPSPPDTVGDVARAALSEVPAERTRFVRAMAQMLKVADEEIRFVGLRDNLVARRAHNKVRLVSDWRCALWTAAVVFVLCYATLQLVASCTYLFLLEHPGWVPPQCPASNRPVRHQRSADALSQGPKNNPEPNLRANAEGRAAADEKGH